MSPYSMTHPSGRQIDNDYHSVGPPMSMSKVVGTQHSSHSLPRYQVSPLSSSLWMRRFPGLTTSRSLWTGRSTKTLLLAPSSGSPGSQPGSWHSPALCGRFCSRSGQLSRLAARWLEWISQQKAYYLWKITVVIVLCECIASCAHAASSLS